MDFELNEEQAVILAALDSATDAFRTMSANDRQGYHAYCQPLDDQIVVGGFLGAVQTEGMGPLEAMLIVERIARLPYVVEVAASALVLPHIDPALPRPLAMLRTPLGKPQRFLPVARTGVLDIGTDVLVISIDCTNVESIESIYGYPYGRFHKLPDLSVARRLEPSAARSVRTWSRIAVAAEMAGAMRAALDFTVAYVKERQMFGKTLGHYQVVHHRLAECEQIVAAQFLLTARAAWSGEAIDADLALCHGQMHVRKLIFDLHQFNGAMGLTQEHLLHFWTFRARALQSEMGGANGAALRLGELVWNS